MSLGVFFFFAAGCSARFAWTGAITLRCAFCYSCHFLPQPCPHGPQCRVLAVICDDLVISSAARATAEPCSFTRSKHSSTIRTTQRIEHTAARRHDHTRARTYTHTETERERGGSRARVCVHVCVCVQCVCVFSRIAIQHTSYGSLNSTE